MLYNTHISIEDYLKKNKKSIMTFGLCGCTAVVMYNKVSREIFMGHHPDEREIRRYITKFISSGNPCIIYVKSPEEYVKDDISGEWKSEIKFRNGDRYKSDTIEVIVEGYCTSTEHGSYYNFNGTLYRWIDDAEIKYTNRYGKVNVLYNLKE